MDFSHILKAHAPLSRVQICEYWHQMLEAVHFIHEKGNLVHSDLKPANFLMAKGRLKLIDFGSAAYLKNAPWDVFVGTIGKSFHSRLYRISNLNANP